MGVHLITVQYYVCRYPQRAAFEVQDQQAALMKSGWPKEESWGDETRWGRMDGIREGSGRGLMQNLDNLDGVD